MCRSIEPPTEKIYILCKILTFLVLITLMQAIFLSFSSQIQSLAYLFSAIVFWHSYTDLSYFACIINQIFYVTSIIYLLLQMALNIRSGLYEIYLSSQGIYKICSLIFSIVRLYFNFIAYKQFKQLAYEIHKYQNNEAIDQI